MGVIGDAQDLAGVHAKVVAETLVLQVVQELVRVAAKLDVQILVQAELGLNFCRHYLLLNLREMMSCLLLFTKKALVVYNKTNFYI